MKKFKTESYKNFKCIADKCSLICCSGWNINIDSKTADKWQNSESELFKDINAKLCFTEENDSYIINKQPEEKCLFLCNDKLCRIVKEEGEGMISETCRKFPRIIKEAEDTVFFTVSEACPEAARMIAENSNIFLELEKGLKNLKSENEIKNKLIKCLYKIITEKNLSLKSKLFYIMWILSESYPCEYEEEIERIINELSMPLKEIETETNLKSVNSLVLEIFLYYKNVPLYKELTDFFYEKAEMFKIKSANKAEEKLKKAEKILEEKYKYIILSKFLSMVTDSCTKEADEYDYTEIMAQKFQLILFEYIILRHILFLGTENSFYEYTAYITRITEFNAEEFVNFTEEYFGEYIITKENLNMIL